MGEYAVFFELNRRIFPSGSAEHVIPTWACAVTWDLCFAEPFRYHLPFLLDKKSRIRRSQRAKESRPTSRAHRTKRVPLPHVGQDSPPSPDKVRHSHAKNFSLNFLLASPLCHFASLRGMKQSRCLLSNTYFHHIKHKAFLIFCIFAQLKCAKKHPTHATSRTIR